LVMKALAVLLIAFGGTLLAECYQLTRVWIDVVV
jgi:hypothetical protein